MNVKACRSKVTVILNHKALKAPLKQVTSPLVAAVKPNRITYTQPLDRSRKIGFGRPN